MDAQTQGETKVPPFDEVLSFFEDQSSRGRGETVIGIVVAVGPEAILIDIGRKNEGSLTIAKWKETQGGAPHIGDRLAVSVGSRDTDGYYQLSTIHIEPPKDWTGLQAAYADKSIIIGTVTEQVKGGFRVDIGVRSFMPASRSGVRDADDMPKLVGQQIQCRITKLNTEKEYVVVDRRSVLEEAKSRKREEAFAGLREGSVVHGRVRNVMDFGAFIDLGEVDGLLHVADMDYKRIVKAGDVVKVGDELEVKVLKIDRAAKRISLGLKQLKEDPWTVAARTLNIGDRVNGTVSRLTDFGAFVELLPGVDGLIHLSQLSRNKRVRKPSDLLKVGDHVEAVILQSDFAEHRISLRYKQTLGDSWEAVPAKFPVGSVVEGAVTNVAPFGAFVDLGEGIEGMVHISDITNEKRLDDAREKLVKGQTIRAVVLENDPDRRRLRLGLKQLKSTTVDHYISEHDPREKVSSHAEAAIPRWKYDRAISAVTQPIIQLVVTSDKDPEATLKQFGEALHERAWLVDSAAIPPLVITGILDLHSEDKFVDFAIQDQTILYDLSSILHLEGTSELVMLALYPSGAVRGVPGAIRSSSLGGPVLGIEDLLALIDPDGEFDGSLPTLSFSIRVLAFESK